MPIKRLLAAIAAVALTLVTISPSSATLIPNARLTALVSQASAPASTERLFSLPRMFAADPAWQNRYGCTPVVFIGARGSNQSPVDDDLSFAINTTKALNQNSRVTQLGSTITTLLEGLVSSKLPARGPSLYSYRGVGPVAGMPGYGAHSALNDFFGLLAPSVAQGGKAALATILQVSDSCPKSKFVLVGYSQGAAIMRAAASRGSDQNPEFFDSKVMATLLIGDPTLSSTGLIAQDSLATALNSAITPVTTTRAGTCPENSAVFGNKCIEADGFVATFGTGGWGTNANYRPASWPLKQTGDTGSATVIPNSSSICVERDVICNTSAMQGWNLGLDATSLTGHEVYDKGGLGASFSNFLPTVSTWLGTKGVWSSTKLVESSLGASIKVGSKLGKTLRVCPSQGATTLALAQANGFPGRDTDSACNYTVTDPSGVVAYELARSWTDLNTSGKRRLATFVGAPALNWKLLPKNGTTTAYLRFTNAAGKARVIRVTLPKW